MVKDHASVCKVNVVKVSENSLYPPFLKIKRLFSLLTEHIGTYCIDFNTQ